MATPALRALRRAYPRAELVAAARPAICSLLGGIPSADRFLPLGGSGARAALADARAIRRERCDWAVLLPDSVSAALGPFAARVPLRAGYARDPLRRLLVTHAFERERDANGELVPVSMIERYLRLARALGCADAGSELELAVEACAQESVGQRLLAEGVGANAAVLVVTPGASFGASKLWPPEHFASAADGLARERGLVPVVAPGPGEGAAAAAIASCMEERAVVLDAPPTTLPELAALVARASLVLTNDTGPRHLAVALGVPVIVVMGPTDPRHTSHLLERQRVLREPVACSPCHLKTCPIDHRCMTRLAPERALVAAKELLG